MGCGEGFLCPEAFGFPVLRSPLYLLVEVQSNEKRLYPLDNRLTLHRASYQMLLLPAGIKTLGEKDGLQYSELVHRVFVNLASA